MFSNVKNHCATCVPVHESLSAPPFSAPLQPGLRARTEGRLLSPAVRSAKQRWGDEAWAAVAAAAAADPTAWKSSVVRLFGVLDTDE